jgi:hypothetical protein
MTQTLWSGADEVAEYTEARVDVRYFIPDGSGAMDARLAVVERDGTLTWLHGDHQGSVVATSNGAGQVRGWANYSPSGELGTGANGVRRRSVPGRSRPRRRRPGCWCGGCGPRRR